MKTATSRETVRLVPAAEADFESLATLINHAFARYPINSADRTSVQGLRDEAGDDGAFVVLERQGAMVAAAMVRPASAILAPNSGWPDLAKSLYFGLAAVEPMHMNAGLGRRLIAEAERIAGEQGYGSVVLGTVRELGLIEYYARLGYMVYELQVFPAGHWAITVPHHYAQMIKEL